MEFKTQKQVDNYIESLGVFLSNDELHMKVGNDINEHILINDKRKKIIDYVDKNTSPFVDLTVTFPSLDLKIFSDYKGREQTINQNKVLLDDIKSSKKYLKNNWRLIHLEKPIFIEKRKRIKYLIYDIKEKQINYLKECFVEDKEKNNASSIPNIVWLKNLITENFENQYNQAYDIELKKWENIPIYDLGALND